MKFTVIGARGFIGSVVTGRLREEGYVVLTPAREDEDIYVRPLGHVIYAAGVTADFRRRPFDTQRAHIGLLSKLLEKASFESLLYLSSARVYRHAEHTGEDAAICLRSADPEDFYDLTKLAGEALCHASLRNGVRVVRLSNVVGSDFGSDNFLSVLIRTACDDGHVDLHSAMDSEKDYVLVDDVASLLPKIAVSGNERCYNVGAGRNVAHSEIAAIIAAATGACFATFPGAPRLVVPQIDVKRIRAEFGFEATDVRVRIPILIDEYRKLRNAEN